MWAQRPGVADEVNATTAAYRHVTFGAARIESIARSFSEDLVDEHYEESMIAAVIGFTTPTSPEVSVVSLTDNLITHHRSALMRRLFFAVLSGIILLVAFAVVLSARNHRTSRSSKQIIVMSQTRGDEVLTAEILNDQVRIRLKNNHKDTITAYVIRLNDTTISEDFAYSEVLFA